MTKLSSYADPSRPYQICSRCVMDTTVPEIAFDAVTGECQFCRIHDILDAKYPIGAEGEQRLQRVVARIKAAGAGRPHDCVVGVSGGRDSTWLLMTAVRLGLRPLAVHFDNGWNSEIAVTNIRNAIEKLGVELETVVADWEEFRDIQVAFLKASVPDVEVPTDLAIHSVLHRVAAKEGIQYILNGHSFRTEGVAPRGWTYFDGRYITAIQKRFGTRELRDFHNFGMLDVVRYTFLYRIRVVPILNYRPYNQAEITELITKELGWTYYGGHHHESLYTKFIQSYLLPRKFRIDKRRTELSALIRSGQTTREEALTYLDSHEYEYDESLIPYVLAKLELTEAQWLEIWNTPPKSYLDYPSYYPLLQAFRTPIKWLAEHEIIPKLLYLKYLG
jgi:N-acetyl sugar amidotransferase